MDYESKYKDAFERAKKIHKYSSDLSEIKRMEHIFPELKENEDERIKETLIDYFKTYKKQEECGIKTFFGIPTDDIISWLEKQGQRPQTTWKPSKEQIYILSWIANVKLGDSVVEQEVSKHLNELYKDLKKLREE